MYAFDENAFAFKRNCHEIYEKKEMANGKKKNIVVRSVNLDTS